MDTEEIAEEITSRLENSPKFLEKLREGVKFVVEKAAEIAKEIDRED